MRTFWCRCLALGVLAFLGFGGSSPAFATVLDYSTFAQSQTDAIVQYDFVGTTDSQQREDKSSGTNDLTEKTVGTPTGSIAYNVAGFDGTSAAVTPLRVDSNNGMAFFTSQAIDMPSSVSFEAIIMPTAIVESYMAGGRATTNNRNYFVAQVDSNPALRAVAGNDFNTRTDIVNPFTAGNWYYVAVTMSYDSGANATTINTWSADLTAGDQDLTHTATETQTGTFVNNTNLGIGLLNNNGSPYRPWAGTIDEVTLYDGLKDADFFNANLDRVLVPEPSTLLLAVLGLLGLAAFGRWRNQR